MGINHNEMHFPIPLRLDAASIKLIPHPLAPFSTVFWSTQGHHQTSQDGHTSPWQHDQGWSSQQWPLWMSLPDKLQVMGPGRRPHLFCHPPPPCPHLSLVGFPPGTPNTGSDDETYIEEDFHQWTWAGDVPRYSFHQWYMKPWSLSHSINFWSLTFATQFMWMLEHHYEPLFRNAKLNFIFCHCFPIVTLRNSSLLTTQPIHPIPSYQHHSQTLQPWWHFTTLSTNSSWHMRLGSHHSLALLLQSSPLPILSWCLTA